METSFGLLDIRMVKQGVHKIEKSIFGVVRQKETGFYEGEIFIVDAKAATGLEEEVRSAARGCQTFEEFANAVITIGKRWKAIVQVRFNFGCGNSSLPGNKC